MNTRDSISVIPAGSAEGEVVLSEVDVRFPGLSRAVLETKNQMSYAAADAVASAYGGDTSLVPRYIGFVYGPNPYPTGLSSVFDRSMDWDSLKSQVNDAGGNVQVSEFSSRPYVSAVQPSGDSNGLSPDWHVYSGNSVTFQACTRSGSSSGFVFSPKDGVNSFSGPLQDGDYLYQALLLGDTRHGPCRSGSAEGYTILARTSLSRASSEPGGARAYRQKPSGYELVLSWRVTFY